MILSLPRFLVAPLLVSMSDARGDAESKQRAKRERLEAWRREQAEKKRAEASGDSSPKRARVEKPFGFRSAAAAHKVALPRVRLGGMDDEAEPTHRQVPRAKLALDEPDHKSPAKPDTADDAETDPLDAYMSTLESTAGQTPTVGPAATELMSSDEGEAEASEDDNELDLTRTEDILALAAKRSKKKDLPSVDHGSISYEPFRKNFYHAPEEIASMTPTDVERTRMELGAISARGRDCPAPIRKWAHCGMPVSCLDVIKQMGYAGPTPIQAQAIPAIMSGRDMIGVAQTGSGKTLAFLLPMFRHIKDQRPLEAGDGPIALVMTPTRELAVQIFREAQPFLKVLGLRGACVYGGTPISEQIAELKRSAEFVVATPGRMIDLLAANSGRVTNLRRVTYLVMDEADRMFDLGFEPQVMKIVGLVRPDRQTVLFSATFPKPMESLARKLLRHAPLEITVGGRSVVAPEIKQLVEVREEHTKFHRLLELLGQMYNRDEDARTLIFVERQESADELLHQLMRKGYPTLSLHGGKDQADRDSTISDFKAGVAPVMTATSVAARGLDVKQLRLVVNYDVPSHMEDYVHRAGRTGRAGEHGTCVTFVTPEQDRYARDIIVALRASKADVPPELEALAEEFKEKLRNGTAHLGRSGFGGRGLERLEVDRERLLITHQSSFAEEDPVAEAARDREDAAKMGDLNFEVRTGAVPEALRDNRQPVYTAADAAANQARIDAARAAGADTAKLQEVIARINAVSNSRREVEAAEYARRTRDPDATKFHALIPINDFPQRARWKVTNKETMAQLIDTSGASSTYHRNHHLPTVTNKGAFYEKGREPQPGEPPKLTLLIESNDQWRVESAVREIKRLLLEGTQEFLDTDSRTPSVGGRYTVV